MGSPDVRCPYGTSKWQLHDDKAQNVMLKLNTMLRIAKKNMYEKKRLASLPIKIQPDEIVLGVKEAVELSFMNVKIHFPLYPDGIVSIQ